MNLPVPDQQKRQNERQLRPISRSKTATNRAAELRVPTYVGSNPHLSLFFSSKEEMKKFPSNRHLSDVRGPQHLDG
jgi:hypothetical protein